MRSQIEETRIFIWHKFESRYGFAPAETHTECCKRKPEERTIVNNKKIECAICQQDVDTNSELRIGERIKCQESITFQMGMIQ